VTDNSTQKPLSCIPTQRLEEWWLQRHTDKLAEKANTELNNTEKKITKRTFDLVFIGDSIVHAWELEGESAHNKYLSKLNILNLGFAGDRTEHALWRIEQGEIDNIQAKYVILLIGTNNAGHRHDKPAEIAAGVQSIIKSIQKKLPNSTIILTAIFPRSRNRNKRMRKAVEASNGIIQSFANNNSVLWFDINERFLDEDGVLYESVMPDLLHPNAEQYEIWARELVSFVNIN
jgi:lysophospholipase L1-like esterase